MGEYVDELPVEAGVFASRRVDRYGSGKLGIGLAEPTPYTANESTEFRFSELATGKALID
jgi:hypothetical protein